MSGSIFNMTSSGGVLKNLDGDPDNGVELGSGLGLVGFAAATASTINVMNTGLRRIYNISFNNTLNLTQQFISAEPVTQTSTIVQTQLIYLVVKSASRFAHLTRRLHTLPRLGYIQRMSY